MGIPFSSVMSLQCHHGGHHSGKVWNELVVIISEAQKTLYCMYTLCMGPVKCSGEFLRVHMQDLIRNDITDEEQTGTFKETLFELGIQIILPQIREYST